MTASLTNGLTSFINQFDFIEESLMDYLLESVLRLGALTETRLFLLVEGRFVLLVLALLTVSFFPFLYPSPTNNHASKKLAQNKST